MGRGNERPLLQIIGDGVAGRWLSWRWNDPSLGVGVQRLDDLEAVLARFHDALPRSDVQQLADLRLTGPLTCPEVEQQLMHDLATVLLPEALREQLSAVRDRGLIEVRVMPSPRLARVPWGLLPIDGERRLVEVADLSWMAPLLPRDLGADPDPSPDPGGTGRVVYVLDPFVLGQPRVHPTALRPEDWGGGSRDAHVVTRSGNRGFDEQQLIQLLEGSVGLLLLGHAVHDPHRPGQTCFLVSWDRFGADDLIFDELTVPPRVAIDACASGVDLADPEPLGLATAFLLKGAESVTATLWPLPTATALDQVTPGAGAAFLELTTAFDRAMQAKDPVAELCRHQRERLRAWRDEGGVRNSPILWGAAMTLTAPRQRCCSQQLTG